MRFTLDRSSNINVVRAYGPGEVRVNDEVFRHSVIVAASAIRPEPAVSTVADLGTLQVERILELDPELVLIGTGARQVFPAASFGARFLEKGIGFDVMDTGAACRTFNVLMSEQRRAVALLLL